jgi:hypothetical protein
LSRVTLSSHSCLSPLLSFRLHLALVGVDGLGAPSSSPKAPQIPALPLFHPPGPHLALVGVDEDLQHGAPEEAARPVEHHRRVGVPAGAQGCGGRPAGASAGCRRAAQPGAPRRSIPLPRRRPLRHETPRAPHVYVGCNMNQRPQLSAKLVSPTTARGAAAAALPSGGAAPPSAGAAGST